MIWWIGGGTVKDNTIALFALAMCSRSPTVNTQVYAPTENRFRHALHLQ